MFDPSCPIPYRQFVSIKILNGTTFLFQALDFVLQIVGDVVHSRFEGENEESGVVAPIHALVVIEDFGLVPHIQFSLLGGRLLIILVEYKGLHICCSHYGSYTHFLESCFVLFPTKGNSSNSQSSNPHSSHERKSCSHTPRASTWHNKSFFRRIHSIEIPIGIAHTSSHQPTV